MLKERTLSVRDRIQHMGLDCEACLNIDNLILVFDPNVKPGEAFSKYVEIKVHEVGYSGVIRLQFTGQNFPVRPFFKNRILSGAGVFEHYEGFSGEHLGKLFE